MTAPDGSEAMGGDGAPEVLSARSRRYLEGVTPSTPWGQLAIASRRALEAAMSGQPRREAALDLLAADALITEALLEVARHRPEALLEEAVALRQMAEGTL